MDPLETLEQEIWKDYRLDGDLESNRLFKECQRRTAAVDRSNAGNKARYVHFITGIFEAVFRRVKTFYNSHYGAQNKCGVSPSASQDEQWMIAMHNLHLLRQKKLALLSWLLEQKSYLGVDSTDISVDTSVSDAVCICSFLCMTIWLTLFFTQVKLKAGRFWAVIIGIDYYPFGDHLNGAVNDARSMYDYLRQDLGVPESNIKLLLQPLNSNTDLSAPNCPTRANILDTIYTHLRDNTMVAYGDNIFIYFAGHGSFYHAIDDRFFTSIAGRSGTIEAICPADRYLEDPHDDNHTQVAGIDISDRELNIILSEIAKKHGNHITVILDCCHSGGMARSLKLEPRRKTRYLGSSGKTLSTMLAAADRDPRRFSGSPRALNDKWCFDFSTHVMMSACKDIETAGEDYGHGLFTTALLKSLQSSFGRNPDTTYHQLIHSRDMKLPFQTPVIAGSGQNSTLWFRKECMACG